MRWLLMGISATCVLLIVLATTAAPPRDSSVPKLPDGIYYTTIDAPCALNADALSSLTAAIRDQDQAAIKGLVDRGKLLALAKGTRFEASSDEAPWEWGFVRSGRETGRTCYILRFILGAESGGESAAPGRRAAP